MINSKHKIDDCVKWETNRELHGVIVAYINYIGGTYYVIEGMNNEGYNSGGLENEWIDENGESLSYKYDISKKYFYYRSCGSVCFLAG